MLNLSCIRPVGTLLSWLLYLFPIIFDYFLSGTSGSSQFMLYFPCPSLGISHFFKESWFLLVENGILEAKVWIPGMLIDAG